LQAPNVLGRIEEGKKIAKKQMDILIHGLWGRGNPSPLMPEVYTPSGWPAVSTPVLRALAGKPGAAKKALAELEGQDTNAGAPASSFDGAHIADLPSRVLLVALQAGAFAVQTVTIHVKSKGKNLNPKVPSWSFIAK
jgi:hypothetical protein